MVDTSSFYEWHLPGDAPNKFSQFRDLLMLQFHTENPLDAHLIERFIVSQWSLVQYEKVEAALIADEANAIHESEESGPREQQIKMMFRKLNRPCNALGETQAQRVRLTSDLIRYWKLVEPLRIDRQAPGKKSTPTFREYPTDDSTKDADFTHHIQELEFSPKSVRTAKQRQPKAGGPIPLVLTGLLLCLTLSLTDRPSDLPVTPIHAEPAMSGDP